MQIKLLSFLILISALAFGQEKHFDIKWNGVVALETAYSSITVPSFDKDHFSFDITTGLLFSARWKSDVAINKGSVILTNVSYSNISVNELQSVPLETIPTAPQLFFENTVARGETHAYLEVTPIIKENGIYKKITSFTISYNSSNTSGNRVSNAVFDQSHSMVNSVLSSGNWYRF